VPSRAGVDFGIEGGKGGEGGERPGKGGEGGERPGPGWRWRGVGGGENGESVRGGVPQPATGVNSVPHASTRRRCRWQARVGSPRVALAVAIRRRAPLP
jgi:hypothetical protein